VLSCSIFPSSSRTRPSSSSTYFLSSISSHLVLIFIFTTQASGAKRSTTPVSRIRASAFACTRVAWSPGKCTRTHNPSGKKPPPLPPSLLACCLEWKKVRSRRHRPEWAMVGPPPNIYHQTNQCNNFTVMRMMIHGETDPLSTTHTHSRAPGGSSEIPSKGTPSSQAERERTVVCCGHHRRGSCPW
jgi:hypothetical protein